MQDANSRIFGGIEVMDRPFITLEDKGTGQAWLCLEAAGDCGPIPHSYYQQLAKDGVQETIQ